MSAQYGYVRSGILDDHPELVGFIYVIRIIFTIFVLVVVVWLSIDRWYNKDTGEIDTWSILGIAVVTVFFTNLTFTLIL